MGCEKHCDFCGKRIDDFYYILPHFLKVGVGHRRIRLGSDQVNDAPYTMCENCKQKITVFIEKMKMNKR